MLGPCRFFPNNQIMPDPSLALDSPYLSSSGSNSQIIKKLRRRLNACDEQVISGAGASDV